jgi:anti-sigma B factor antagonist
VSAAEPTLTFDVSEGPDGVLVHLFGGLNMASEIVFIRDILPFLSHGRRQVVIDLSGLTDLDSTGLSCLIRAWQRLDEQGVSLRLIRGSDIVRQLLGMSRLTEKPCPGHGAIESEEG